MPYCSKYLLVVNPLLLLELNLFYNVFQTLLIQIL